MNPSAGRVPSIQIEVRADRATVLPGRVWCAERSRGLVAIVHGLGEHSARYGALAEALVESGFTTVALDLPGHGEAPGARGDTLGWVAWRDTIVPLMFTVTRGLPGQPPDLPVVLLGHSMGGLMALDYALAHPRTIMAVVASAPSLKGEKPPVLKLALAKIVRTISPGTAFPHGLDNNDMSRDEEVRALRKSDPLMHDRITPRLYFDLVAARARVLAEARRLSVPALIQQGAADRVSDPAGALEFNGLAPHGMVRLLTYSGGFHEIYNDPVREQAISDLLGWLDAVVVV